MRSDHDTVISWQLMSCRKKGEKDTVESARHVHHWPVRRNTIPITGHIHTKPGRDILTDGSVDPFGHLNLHLQ